MNGGILFEDFVPISDTEALITSSKNLARLHRIEKVPYTIEGNRVLVRPGGELLVRGNRKQHLRLGGVFEGRLVYSADSGIMGASVQSKTAHQPFVYQGRVYYTDYATKGKPQSRIYCDGSVFVDWFSARGGDYCQVTNPCWGDGYLYFEARTTMHPLRCDAWEIWRRSPEGVLQYIGPGANPAFWDGWLFWGVWNGKHFDYQRARADALPCT